jgi:hypothetical protein
MTTKILLTCAAFVALAATSQMIRRTRRVYVRPMGWIEVRERRLNLAMAFYGVAVLLGAIAWIVGDAAGK